MPPTLTFDPPRGGAAGLYRLHTVAAPVDPISYTVDVHALAALARTVRPKLITIGGSLNHPPRGSGDP